MNTFVGGKESHATGGEQELVNGVRALFQNMT
jgi:hypothetical protein